MTSGVGGVETFISNLLDKIDKKHFKVDLLLFQEVDHKYTRTIKEANKVYYVSAINKNPLKYFVDIVKFYKYHNYDIIHVNECTAKLFVYCWPCIFVKKTKLIVHSHSGNGKKSLSHMILKKWQNSVADEFWSCSKEATQWMFGKKGSKKKLVKMINNGINVKKYLYSPSIRSIYRNKLDIGTKTTVIGSIARFETQKNHAFIINIFNNYLKTHPNSLLILVGNGSLKENIINKTIELGIKKNVLYLGNRDDIPELLQTFDVLLMPSFYEGLPFVGLESQAAGVPIVASDTVDKGLKITNLIHFLSLNANMSEWLNAIDNAITHNNRNEDQDYIKKSFLNAHYDLNETIRYIEKSYNEL